MQSAFWLMHRKAEREKEGGKGGGGERREKFAQNSTQFSSSSPILFDAVKPGALN